MGQPKYCEIKSLGYSWKLWLQSQSWNLSNSQKFTETKPQNKKKVKWHQPPLVFVEDTSERVVLQTNTFSSNAPPKCASQSKANKHMGNKLRHLTREEKKGRYTQQLWKSSRATYPEVGKRHRILDRNVFQRQQRTGCRIYLIILKNPENVRALRNN